MGLNLKRTMKSVAVDGARLSDSIGADFVTRRLLKKIQISYDASPAGIRYPGNARGAACISIDFDVTRNERYGPSRAGTEKLLELSERYEIPLTWAICGKTAVEEAESYNRILNSPTKQEIGIHTYSHIDALKCSAAEFEEDIGRCLDALNLRSAPRTFIFPWNRENHFEVLRRMGFKTYRGKERVIGPPDHSMGLWNERPVFYVDQKSYGAESLMMKYADLCARTSAVFHLWTHPWSIVIREDPNPMFKTLDPVFSHLRDMRQRGDLAVCTMGEIADHFDSVGASAAMRGAAQSS